MIEQAINKIQELTRAQVVQVDAEPKHVYFFAQNGELTRHEAAQPPRKDELYTLESLLGMLKRELNGVDLTINQPTIYVGRDGVVALLSAANRRERFTLPLPQSREYHTLKNLAEGRAAMKHRDFVNLLRIDLAGCVEPDVIKLFSEIKVAANGENESAIRVGKESIGRRATAAALGAGHELPEDITVTLAIYRDLTMPKYQVPVVCALVTDLQEMTFRLIPKAGQLEAAERAVGDELIGSLEAAFASYTGLLVVQGSPS